MVVTAAVREALSAPREALLRYPRTPLRAARAIALLTLLITVVSGVVMHLIDRSEFPTIGVGLWWAAQTVTTVGYGDVAPAATSGRIVALIVMLNAIGFLTVVTGSITAALIGSRARGGLDEASLEELRLQLERLETVLRERQAR